MEACINDIVTYNTNQSNPKPISNVYINWNIYTIYVLEYMPLVTIDVGLVCVVVLLVVELSVSVFLSTLLSVSSFIVVRKPDSLPRP